MLKAGRLVHLCRGIIAANFRIKVPMQALYFADLDKKVVETRNPLMTVCVCVRSLSLRRSLAQPSRYFVRVDLLSLWRSADFR